ncbi:MAG: pseudouridine synthase [Helicobacter sp.]|nr:pseudouridine synthase [Helicobacter sp.]
MKSSICAYKLLSIQQNISHKEAKRLIDRGLVSLNNIRIKIARQNIDPKAILELKSIQKIQEIFSDQNILALNKPCFINASEVLKKYPNWVLLNRLDRETSGIILAIKPESDFAKKAINEFKNKNVYKEYRALVSPSKNALKMLENESKIILNKPLKIIKNGSIYSQIASPKDKNKKEALTEISLIKPKKIEGKIAFLLKIVIKTGLSHQIRVHLSDFGAPILGDTKYGGVEFYRMALHALNIKLLGYDFTKEPDLILQ